MRTILGILAIFVGIPLVCLGAYGLLLGIGLSNSEPEFSNGIAGYGTVALSFGCLLCWAAWKRAKHDDEQ